MDMEIKSRTIYIMQYVTQNLPVASLVTYKTLSHPP